MSVKDISDNKSVSSEEIVSENERFRLGLEPLKQIGTKYFADNLFNEEFKKREYNKNRIPIGTRRSGSPFHLDISEACRIVFHGRTRTGKSWLIRAITDRLYKVGYSVVYLPDIKNEYRSSINPLQDKFHKFLLSGEKPEAIKTAALRPTIFTSVDRGKIPEDNKWFSVNPKELEKSDFATLLNSDRAMTPNQQIMLDILQEKMDKTRMKVDTGEAFIGYIEALVDRMDEFSVREKEAFVRKFRPLLNSQFYIPEHEKNIVTLIKGGYRVAVNMNNWDSLNNGMAEVLISAVLRQLVMARDRDIIPELWIVVDEAPRFIPKQGEPSCKIEFINSADVDTGRGVNYLYGTQELQKLPDVILNQCRYIFIPYNANVDVFKEWLNRAAITKSPHSAKKEAMDIKRGMNEYEWLVLDMQLSEWDIVKPAAPLSHHLETKH